jgi:2,3-bisphosphoglycerate-independent phosphoglycerate mutase
MPKVLFLIGDGMAGRPVAGLGGRTTLQAAHTPAMDFLAAGARCGLCRTVPQGMPPGSDVANMSLLGYDPAVHHTGRGPIEAAAQGLVLDPDDLVWRMNLVSVSEWSAQGVMLDYSSGHITTAESAPLLAKLAELARGSDFSPVAGIQYRHLLVQKNGARTPAATLDVRPPHDILDQNIAQDLDTFATIPELARFMDQAHALLRKENTKADAVWPWGQGRPLILPNFQEKFGLRGAVVSAVDLVKGLGRAAGMDVLHVDGVTGLIDTNYEGKIQAAIDFLKQGDFVYVHVEAPDECGHMGDAELKRQAIELFDQCIVAPAVEAMRNTDAVIVVTCDHLTPVDIRTHAPDPVPFLVYAGRSPRADGPKTFDEKTAAATGLFLPTGQDLMALALGARS